MNLHNKINSLTTLLKNNHAPFFIACSGGLDSRFLAHFARYIGIKNIHLLHIVGAHIDPAETQYLKIWAEKYSFTLKIIPLDIMALKEIKNNIPLRCYYCKYAAFSHMIDYIQSQHNALATTHNHPIIYDGTHFDDTKTHRPGLLALKELNILSPLALSHFTKKDIIKTAIEIGLENPMQKAKPCLLTRFHYNTLINLDKINLIIKAENIVSTFFKKEYVHTNMPNFRIREVKPDTYELHTTENLSNSQIETLQSNLKQVTLNEIKFKKIKILSGYFDRIQEEKQDIE